MNKKITSQQSVFESIRRINREGREFWSARQLSKILGYLEYRNFLPVIEKSKEACRNSGQNIQDHYVQVHEMVDIGSAAKREVQDVQLSRYACYLIVQNADPSKSIVALGQTYFAVQTRKQELIEERQYQNLKSEDERRIFLRNQLRVHNQKLAGAAKTAGVIKPIDYAIFQDHGYKGLYAGLTSQDIHKRKNLKNGQQILDYMASTELAANLFRATQTQEKLERDQVKDKLTANQTHFDVGKKVRRAIEEIGGTMPEDLPTANNIKYITKKKIKNF